MVDKVVIRNFVLISSISLSLPLAFAVDCWCLPIVHDIFDLVIGCLCDYSYYTHRRITYIAYETVGFVEIRSVFSIYNLHPDSSSFGSLGSHSCSHFLATPFRFAIYSTLAFTRNELWNANLHILSNNFLDVEKFLRNRPFFPAPIERIIVCVFSSLRWIESSS